MESEESQPKQLVWKEWIGGQEIYSRHFTTKAVKMENKCMDKNNGHKKKTFAIIASQLSVGGVTEERMKNHSSFKLTEYKMA